MLPESLHNIHTQKMLIPSFINSCDHPDDICDLPYGYETYISSYPKLKRSEMYRSILCISTLIVYYRTNVLFERYFIRETVKSLEVHSIFNYFYVH